MKRKSAPKLKESKREGYKRASEGEIASERRQRDGVLEGRERGEFERVSPKVPKTKERASQKKEKECTAKKSLPFISWVLGTASNCLLVCKGMVQGALLPSFLSLF